MNKEFPFDRWFRKNVGPGRFIAFIFIVIMIMVFGPAVIPYQIGSNISFVLIGITMACAIPILVWQVYWHIQYPTEVEFCKECGQAKPIKYED